MKNTILQAITFPPKRKISGNVTESPKIVLPSPKNIPNAAMEPRSCASWVIRASSDDLAIPVIVNIIAANRLYVKKAYMSCIVSDPFCGMKKISTTASPVGTDSQSSHGRALPQRVRVLSMRTPARMSVMPSKSLEIRNMVPTAPAAMPMLSV